MQADLQDHMQRPRQGLPRQQLGLLALELPLEVLQHVCQAAMILSKPTHVTQCMHSLRVLSTDTASSRYTLRAGTALACYAQGLHRKLCDASQDISCTL